MIAQETILSDFHEILKRPIQYFMDIIETCFLDTSVIFQMWGKQITPAYIKYMNSDRYSDIS